MASGHLRLWGGDRIQERRKEFLQLFDPAGDRAGSVTQLSARLALGIFQGEQLGQRPQLGIPIPYKGDKLIAHLQIFLI